MPRRRRFGVAAGRLVVPVRVVGDPAVQQEGEGQLSGPLVAHLLDQPGAGPEKTPPASLLFGVGHGSVGGVEGQIVVVRVVGEVLSLQRKEARPTRPGRPLLCGEQLPGQVAVHLCRVDVAVGQRGLRGDKEDFGASQRLKLQIGQRRLRHRASFLRQSCGQQGLGLVDDEVSSDEPQLAISVGHRTQQAEGPGYVGPLVRGDRLVVNRLSRLEILPDGVQEYPRALGVLLCSKDLAQRQQRLAASVERSTFPERVLEGSAALDRAAEVVDRLPVMPQLRMGVTASVEELRQRPGFRQRFRLGEPGQALSGTTADDVGRAQSREDVALSFVIMRLLGQPEGGLRAGQRQGDLAAVAVHDRKRLVGHGCGERGRRIVEEGFRGGESRFRCGDRQREDVEDRLCSGDGRIRRG